ncbi:MAG: hypothetical protein ABDH28_00695 [Brevinematia bacterium]
MILYTTSKKPLFGEDIPSNVRVWEQEAYTEKSLESLNAGQGTIRTKYGLVSCFITSERGLVVSPQSEIVSSVKFVVKAKNFTGVIQEGEREYTVSVEIEAKTTQEAKELTLLEYGRINFITFSLNEYLQPATVVVSSRSNKEYITTECVKEGNTYVYIAIRRIRQEDISIITGTTNATDIPTIPLPVVANLTGTTVNLVEASKSIRLKASMDEVFTLWLTNQNRDTFLSGQSFGVVASMLGETYGLVQDRDFVVFSSPFTPSGFNWLHVMRIPARLVDATQGSFTVVAGPGNARSISSGEFNWTTNRDDNTWFDIYYQTQSNNWVKGGMCFWEDGTITTGFAGVYFTYGNLPNIRVVGKASNTNNTMAFLVLKFQIEAEPVFVYETSIQKNPTVWQKICDLPKFPRFIKVLLGNASTNEWIQDEISHYYHHHNVGATAIDRHRLGGANTKQIQYNTATQKWELWVRCDGHFSAFGPNDINRVRVVVW